MEWVFDMVKFERLDGSFCALEHGKYYDVKCGDMTRLAQPRILYEKDATSPFFLYCIDGDNGWIFSELKIDKYDYITNILGYTMGGDWPPQKTMEDFWPPQKTMEDLNKVAERLYLDYGVTFTENATGGNIRRGGRL